MITVNLCMPRVAALFLLVLACDSGSADDEASGEPTLEELIAECEDVAECAACPSERQAIEDWQEVNPQPWAETCAQVCVAECDGGACDPEECAADCEAERAGLEAEWQAQSDLNFDALQECEAGCYEAPAGQAGCGVEGDEVLWCPILVGLDVARGEAVTCDGRLTEIFG